MHLDCKEGEIKMDAIPVFLVDNNPALLRITAHLLREEYFDEFLLVGMSSNDEHALHQVRSLKPRVIVVCRESYDPDDLALVRQLRKAFPESGIVVLGTLDMESRRKAALAAGADAYLARTFMDSELAPVVRRVAGKPAERSRAVGTSFNEMALAYLIA
jgi:DNA-binding NarL/FixJ family response regulator